MALCNCNGSCSGGRGCGGGVVNGSGGDNYYQPQLQTAVPNYPYGYYPPYNLYSYPPYNPWAPWGVCGGCCRCRGCQHMPMPSWQGGIAQQGYGQHMQCGSQGVLNETKTCVANVTGPLTSSVVQVDLNNPPKGVYYSNGNSNIPTD